MMLNIGSATCIHLQGHCCDHLTLTGDAKGLSHMLHFRDEETGLVAEVVICPRSWLVTREFAAVSA